MTSQSSKQAEELLDVIELAINKYTQKLRDNFIRTTVQEISSDYKYKVGINGADYYVISGCGMTFEVGEPVWVHVPNNDYKKAYICAAASTRQLTREIVTDVTDELLANYVLVKTLEASYVTIDALNNALNNYYTKDEVDALIAGGGNLDG